MQNKQGAEIINLSAQRPLEQKAQMIPSKEETLPAEKMEEVWDVEYASINPAIPKKSFIQKVKTFWNKLPRFVQAFFYTFFLVFLGFPLTAFVGWIEINVAPFLMKALVDTVNWASGSLFPILQEAKPEHVVHHAKHLHKTESYQGYFLTNIFPVLAMMGVVFFIIRNVMFYVFSQTRNLNILLTVLFAPVSYFFLLHLLHIR